MNTAMGGMGVISSTSSSKVAERLSGCHARSTVKTLHIRTSNLIRMSGCRDVGLPGRRTLRQTADIMCHHLIEHSSFDWKRKQFLTKHSVKLAKQSFERSTTSGRWKRKEWWRYNLYSYKNFQNLCCQVKQNSSWCLNEQIVVYK